MQYKLGGKIISKKPHACKGREWEIVRVGADVKLKCLCCGKSIFLSYDEVEKITKNYIEGEDDGK